MNRTEAFHSITCCVALFSSRLSHEQCEVQSQTLCKWNTFYL